jgi:hypothetical protein
MTCQRFHGRSGGLDGQFCPWAERPINRYREAEADGVLIFVLVTDVASQRGRRARDIMSFLDQRSADSARALPLPQRTHGSITGRRTSDPGH